MDVRSGVCRRLISIKWLLLGIIVLERFLTLVGESVKPLLFYCNTTPASLLVEQRKMIFYNKTFM